MVTKEVEVDVVSYDKIEKKGTHKVTTYETVWVEKEVDVKKCVAVEKTGTKKVNFWVDVEKEQDVTTWKKVEKTGTRDVMKCVQVEKTVKVAVYAPCASPCSTSTSGGCGSARGGLFKGKGGCCK